MQDPKFQITVDCHDPDAQARFWAAALDYELQPPPEGFATWREYWTSLGVPPDEVDDGFDAIVDRSDRGPRVWFQRVPETKSLKNRIHFDLFVGGGRAVPLEERKRRVRAKATELEAIGATVRNVMDSPGQGHFAIGMNDPEGNEFDVV
ncbi:MAG: VOC family protein [Acidimicrobiia bacterium]|nr:VOC family protein [Acidimicrobiia bacterium]